MDNKFYFNVRRRHLTISTFRVKRTHFKSYEGARRMARMLRGYGFIAWLDLRSTDIGADGCAVLFDARRENRALTDSDGGPPCNLT
jgi:hypothetical protein